MKDGAGLLILSLLLIGGLVLWLSHGQALHVFPSNAYVQPVSPDPKPAPEKKASTKEKHVSHTLKAEAEEPPAPTVVPEPAPPRPNSASPRVAAALPSPFPSSEQITKGAREDRITERYGDPALAATTSLHGHVHETLVYARDGGQAVTVISLEDGTVSSAYSKTPIPPAAGTAIPRRKGS